jgi:hypothetical protein
MNGAGFRRNAGGDAFAETERAIRATGASATNASLVSDIVWTGRAIPPLLM